MQLCFEIIDRPLELYTYAFSSIIALGLLRDIATHTGVTTNGKSFNLTSLDLLNKHLDGNVFHTTRLKVIGNQLIPVNKDGVPFSPELCINIAIQGDIVDIRK